MCTKLERSTNSSPVNIFSLDFSLDFLLDVSFDTITTKRYRLLLTAAIMDSLDCFLDIIYPHRTQIGSMV